MGDTTFVTRETAMKIIQTRQAPNPRRVRVFLAEKGIEVPYEEVDLMKGDLKTPDFTRLNAFQRVPVECPDRGLGGIIGGHGDEPEPA